MQWGPGPPKTGLLVHLSQLLPKSNTVVPLLPWAQSSYSVMSRDERALETEAWSQDEP